MTIELPKPGELLEARLLKFARAHVQSRQDSVSKVPDTVIREAASLVSDLRAKVPEGDRPPGPAEFLDLLRVVGGLGGTKKEMATRIAELYKIVLLKEVAEAD